MSSNQSFTVSEVDVEADWDELMSVFWTTWKTPLQASGELTFPYLDSDTPAEAAAYDTTSAGLLAEAKQNVDIVFWYKAVDDLTHKIVGGVCFKAELGWPDSGTSFTGCGFEPGSERQELSNSFYRQLLAWRPKLANGQHMYGQCLFVLLEYRSTGVARQLIDRGIVEADKRELECFLEGTIFSTPGLLRVGFIVVSWTNMVFARRNPSRDWIRLVRDLQAHPISIMWRPKQGRYVEGETVLPWTGRVRGAKL